MTVLVLGASGKTGRLVVSQLLAEKIAVRVIVRSADDFYALMSSAFMPAELIAAKGNSPLLTVIEANVLALNKQALQAQVQGCSAVISCLGHNLTFSGIYRQPRRLVTQATQRICQAIKANGESTKPVKFILMNTTGNQNLQRGEQVSIAQKAAVWLIRYLIPPHADNEQAAKYLQDNLPTDDKHIQWSVIRPDSLIDKTIVSAYELYPSPIRSAIFNAGITSRINVAHFMVALTQQPTLWTQWKNEMPVIYNQHIQ